MSPAVLVELDPRMVSHVDEEPSIQSKRPAARLQGKRVYLKDLSTGMLCSDLSFCPGGLSWEIKPKLGVADSGEAECGVDGIPRFAMLQCIDFPSKKCSISKFNPVSLFQAVLTENKEQLLLELRALRTASRDPSQNNFRLLNSIDGSLEDLCQVLLNARDLFVKLRALDLLASGMAVEEFVGAQDEVEITADSYREAIWELGARLLAQLEAIHCDRAAIQLVLDTYRQADQPRWVVALFLLGRAAHDISMIVNVRRTCDSLAGKGFVEVAPGLWGRVRVIDTDIKPVARLAQYAKTLRQYLQHENVQRLIRYMRGGASLNKALDAVETSLVEPG